MTESDALTLAAAASISVLSEQRHDLLVAAKRFLDAADSFPHAVTVPYLVARRELSRTIRECEGR